MSTTIRVSAESTGAGRSQRATAFPFPASGTSSAPDRSPGVLSHHTMSDERLLGLIGKYDKSAMHALYSRYSVRLYRFVTRLTGDTSLSDDLVSEVFVDVWRNAKTFRAQSKASTWLYSIARHKAFTALRRKRVDAFDDEIAAVIEDVTDTPEESMLERDRSKLLQLCLSKLSTLHREVIDLVYYHEKPIHEVARIVGVPENTIKTRLHYARNHIEQLLAQSGMTTLH